MEILITLNEFSENLDPLELVSLDELPLRVVFAQVKYDSTSIHGEARHVRHDSVPDLCTGRSFLIAICDELLDLLV